MAASVYSHATQNSSHRGVAMVLALVSAIVLSPLYANRKNEARYEMRWSSGFVLPMVLAGLIIALKTMSSSSSHREARGTVISSSDSSGRGSSWGLACVLVMLMVVLSWQDYVQHLFWR